MSNAAASGMYHFGRITSRAALCSGISAVAILSLPNTALAETAAPTASASAVAVEEIVVTAQKRQERLQDVPIAVTAFNSKALVANSVTSLNDLTGLIPNVVLESSAGFPNTANFTIRGINSGGNPESTAEPAIGLSVDGVYLSRAVGAITDLFDIDSIEVLRGPQGSLYGRNTIGGVINIKTKQPTNTFGGDLQVTVGDNGRAEFRGLVNVPLVKDVLAAKLVITDLQYNGYQVNKFYDGKHVDGVNSFSTQGVLKYTPNTNFDATLSIDYSRDRDGIPGYSNGAFAYWPQTFLIQQLGYFGDPNANPWEVNDPVVGYYNDTTTGETLNANWNLGFATLTSVTGHREFDDNTLNEYGGAPINFVSSQRLQTESQTSEELRLTSNANAKLAYVLGAYYMHTQYELANHEYGLLFGGPDVGSTYTAGQALNAYAQFGQLDYHVTSRATLTFGWRYSDEVKDFHLMPLFAPLTKYYHDSWSNFSPKGEANYRITDDLMVYASYTEGFRSGGFNGRAGSYTSVGPYNAEDVAAYETGFKSELFDHRLRLNGDVFLNKYTNMQVSVQRQVPGSDPPSNESFISNAASANIYGAELEAHSQVTRNLSLDASVGYLHARYNRFFANLDGTGVKDWSALPLALSPTWTAAVGGTYQHETQVGTFSLTIDAVYNSDQYADTAALDLIEPFNLRKANIILDSTIAWDDPDKLWRVAFWCKNMTNRAILYTRDPLGDLAVEQVYKPPRTFGLVISRKF